MIHLLMSIIAGKEVIVEVYDMVEDKVTIQLFIVQYAALCIPVMLSK